MLPWVTGFSALAFLGHQPTPDSLNTPATLNNANTVLAVPYIEKALEVTY